MPQNNPPIPGRNKQIVNVVRDRHGRVILRMGVEETTVFQPDGSVTTSRDSENIQLVDGSVYNPAMSMGAKPVMLIAVCEDCRSPRTLFERASHGLCSREAGHVCPDCGRFVCPKHAKNGLSDGQVRCRRCAARFIRRKRVVGVLKWLFFKSED